MAGQNSSTNTSAVVSDFGDKEKLLGFTDQLGQVVDLFLPGDAADALVEHPEEAVHWILEVVLWAEADVCTLGELLEGTYHEAAHEFVGLEVRATVRVPMDVASEPEPLLQNGDGPKGDHGGVLGGVLGHPAHQQELDASLGERAAPCADAEGRDAESCSCEPLRPSLGGAERQGQQGLRGQGNWLECIPTNFARHVPPCLRTPDFETLGRVP